MDKYHINPEKGVVSKCNADKVPCRFGTSNHYSSLEEGYAALEEQNRDKQFVKHKVAKKSETTPKETIFQKEIAQQYKPETPQTIQKETADIFTRADGSGVFKKLVMPSIYAFRSPELDAANNRSFVKVGDTKRTVNERMAEWMEKGYIYENLEVLYTIEASFLDEHGRRVYVRDYNFHKDLESMNFKRLVKVKDKFDMLGTTHISQEFFFDDVEPENARSISKEIIEESLQKQKDTYGQPGNGYQYYASVSSQRVDMHYYPESNFKPRPFQQKIIDQSSNYLMQNVSDGDNNNFLLSAPTRSGKSFMAAQTAKKIFDENDREHNTVLIVSGFAEIEDEWKRAYESHKEFNQKEYGTAETNKCGTEPCSCKSKFVYLNKNDLVADENAVQKAFDNGAENVAVFLTLQDLAGSTSGRKNRNFKAHEFLRDPDSVQLIMGDESHFAMFTEDGEYQRILNNSGDDVDSEEQDANVVNSSELTEASAVLQQLHPQYGKLFITATPYNVLSEGKHFDVDRNVAIISEAEIVREKKKWDEENLSKDATEIFVDPDEAEDVGYRPWDSPYYGLVEKKWFAIDLGGDPNEIFAPKTRYAKKSGGRPSFKNPEAVKNIVQGLFGVNTATAPNILKNQNYLDAGLGNNVYISLPLCSSCDAMEDTINTVLKENGLDDEYEVLNISSTDKHSRFTKMSSTEINSHISNSQKKTITLTVNRMGTGVSQEKWDSVFIMRSLKSAQKFTQIAGRCGTPWVTTQSSFTGDQNLCRSCKTRDIRAVGKYLCAECFAEKGEKEEETIFKDRVIKTVEKPSAAVISFDPQQMLKFYYDSTRQATETQRTQNGVLTKGEHIERELEDYLDNAGELFYSNYALEKTGLQKVTAVNILDNVFKYMDSKGVREIAETISTPPKISDSLSSMLRDRVSPAKIAPASEIKAFAEEVSKGNKICFIRGCNNPVRETSVKEELKGPAHYCQEHYEQMMVRRSEEENKRKEIGDAYDKNKNTLVNVSEETTSAEEHTVDKTADEADQLKDHIRTAYANTLLYATLADNDFEGVQSVIDAIEQDIPQESNNFVEGRAATLARHLKIDVNLLRLMSEQNVGGAEFDHAIRIVGNSFKRKLADDVNKWRKFNTTLNSFGRFSANEIPTTELVAQRLVDKLDISKAEWKEFASIGRNAGETEDVAGTIDVGCKSGVNLVKFYDAALKAGLTHDDVASKMYAVPTSPATYELTRKVFEEYGWPQKNLLFIEGVSNTQTLEILRLAQESKQCGAADPRKCKIHGSNDKGTPAVRLRKALQNEFDTIEDDGAREAARELFERAKSMELFKYCISNPPYQDSTQNDVPIYQKFFGLGNSIAEKSSMIFLNGWLTASSKRPLYAVRSDKRIVNVENVKNAFTTAAGASNTTIVVSQRNFDNEGLVPVDGVEKEILKDVTTPTALLAQKAKTKVKGLRIRGGSGNGAYGIRTDYLTANPGNAVLIGDKKNMNSIPPDHFKNPIRVLIKNKPQRGGKTQWFWMDRSAVKQNVEEIDRYRVYGYASNYNHKGGLMGNLEPDEAVGRSRQIFYTSKAKTRDKQQLECARVMRVYKTAIIQRFFEEGINYIPDIDYGSNKDIDWSGDINKQLLNLLDISEEELAKLDDVQPE